MTEKEDKLDIEVALKNREFELSLFWQRSNYFLVLNTALGVAAFSVRIAFIGLLIACFGIVVCWLWYRTNLGSRFWHVFWESEVERLAPKYDLKSFEFSADQAREIVRENIERQPTPPWRRFIDEGVLEKPSVTRHMIYLSLTALTFWLFMLAFHLYALNFGTTPDAPSPLSPPIAASVGEPSTSPPATEQSTTGAE